MTENTPQAQPSQGTVSVVFDNPTDSVATGYLSAMAYAYGHSLAAPVPEPEGWAMLLAGLGVVGICRRRMARGGSRPHTGCAPGGRWLCVARGAGHRAWVRCEVNRALRNYVKRQLGDCRPSLVGVFIGVPDQRLEAHDETGAHGLQAFWVTGC